MLVPTPVRLLTAGLALSLLGLVGPAASAGADESAPVAPPTSEAQQAQVALSRAKALFSGAGSARMRRSSGLPGGTDATMVLTKLTQHVDDLPAADRPVARAILSRPSYGGTPSGNYEHSYRVREADPVCDQVCIHYVTSSTDAVSPTDANNDGLPDYVARVRTTMNQVWDHEITRLGYTAPRSDLVLRDNGGNRRLDVYLQDLPYGLYGYCVPDTADRVTSGYCVLDNDYATDEFPANTPVENLQVTAAHEFFHAVQFGYDSYEDSWLMEGTAAWIEDEVFDGVNDNRQYLASSPISNPEVPLDYSDSTYPPYGAWIFWKFLSEWAGSGASDDQAIVRQVWNAARGARYSTFALSDVLAARGTTVDRVFGTFGTWTRDPARYFSEGAAYRAATLTGSYRLTGSARTTGQQRSRVSHLSHRFYRFTSGSGLSGRFRLKIAVNMADRSRGSATRAVIHYRNGGVRVLGLRLNSGGNGSRLFDFRQSKVASVELELVNASTRFDCNLNSYQTCQGYSRDDRLLAVLNATAVRY